MQLVEEKDERFYIAPSTISGAGNGLFAKVPLKRGDCLEITGVQIKVGSVADLCTDFGFTYKFMASEKQTDRYILPIGYAGIVNHHREKQNAIIRGMKGRSTTNPASGQMVYWMMRDIDAGEEIFGDYGNEWEDAFKLMANEDKDWLTFASYGLYNVDKITD